MAASVTALFLLSIASKRNLMNDATSGISSNLRSRVSFSLTQAGC